MMWGKVKGGEVQSLTSAQSMYFNPRLHARNHKTSKTNTFMRGAAPEHASQNRTHSCQPVIVALIHKVHTFYQVQSSSGYIHDHLI